MNGLIGYLMKIKKNHSITIDEKTFAYFEERLFILALLRVSELSVPGQNLNGFLRILPVFLRIEPTFESSFFSSVEVFD